MPEASNRYHPTLGPDRRPARRHHARSAPTTGPTGNNRPKSSTQAAIGARPPGRPSPGFDSPHRLASRPTDRARSRTGGQGPAKRWSGDRSRRRGPRRRPSADRGSVSAELVIAMPLLLMLILLIAQFALWAHATHIAQAAAAQGLAAARVSNGTTATGVTAANQLLTQLGQGPLREPRVAVSRTGQEATVRVTGSATAVVPFQHLKVHGEAAGPVEVFRTAPPGPPGPPGPLGRIGSGTDPDTEALPANLIMEASTAPASPAAPQARTAAGSP